MTLTFFLGKKERSISCCAVILLFLRCFLSHAQEHPPQPIALFVNNDQSLNFGAFYPANSGGTITVSATGMRSTTGDVIQINQGITYTPALFEIRALPGTIVNLQSGSTTVLTGSNGGTMTLTINESDPASPFITTVPPPGTTQVRVGGTLTVGNISVNKAGSYSGTFAVTFNQE